MFLWHLGSALFPNAQKQSGCGPCSSDIVLNLQEKVGPLSLMGSVEGTNLGFAAFDEVPKLIRELWSMFSVVCDRFFGYHSTF